MKNPRLMTARQRAMMEKEKKSDGTDDTFPVIPAEPLLSLPSGGLLTRLEHDTFLHAFYTCYCICITVFSDKSSLAVHETGQ